MKKMFKYVLVSSLVFGLASCLKDKGFDNGTTGHDLSSVPKVIEIGFKNEGAKSKTFAFNFEDLSVERTILYVRLAAGTVATEDITVKIDTAGTYAGLRLIDTNYRPLPATFYTTTPTSFTVTIPKGESQVGVKLKTNAIQFDPSTIYGLVYKIVSVTPPGYTISGNYGAYTVLFGAKNKYDGVYTMNSYHNRPGYQLLVQNEEMHMVTTGANDVAFYWPQAGSNGHPIMSATGISWYGAAIAPVVRFNPTTNIITDVYNAGDPATPISIYAGALSGVGRYEPATKKMYVYFRYNANDARAFMDTLTYVGPR